jgi:hypothetical protein
LIDPIQLSNLLATASDERKRRFRRSGTFMTYVLALLAAIGGTAAGFTLGAIIAAALAPLLGITGFEGASGYFALLVGGPLGGLVGLVLCTVLVLHRRGHRTFQAVAGRFLLVVLAMTALGAAGLGLAYMSNDILNPNAMPVQLSFEIKLPPNVMPPEGRDLVELQTDKNRMPAVVDRNGQRRDGDRAIITGSVDMYFRTSVRTVALTMPDKSVVLFSIKLGAKPAHAKELGPWQPVDHIAEAGKDQVRPAAPADNYEIRYRAVWPGED